MLWRVRVEEFGIFVTWAMGRCGVSVVVNVSGREE